VYNEKIKTNFIDNIQNNDTQKMYSSIFKRSAAFELNFGKDVYDFNVSECLSLLVGLNPKSVGQVISLKSQFNRYVSWAIENSIASKNYWGLVPADDDFAKAAFPIRYVKDLNELVHVVDTGLSTPYDKYVPYLLFMGIMGDDFNEISLLIDDMADRLAKTITTIRREYGMIEPLFNLLADEGYWKETKAREEDSPYLIKPFKSKNRVGEPISNQYIYRVFKMMNDNFNEGNPNKRQFTPMTIWRSGLFYSLYQIEEIKGSLVRDDYLAVSEIYGNNAEFGTFLREYELYKEVFWSEGGAEELSTAPQEESQAPPTKKPREPGKEERKQRSMKATPGEWNIIEENAVAAGMSLSAYIRHMGLSD